MKKTKHDVVIEEIQLFRKKVAVERSKNPIKYRSETQLMMEKFGMKKSKLTPAKIDFSKIHKKSAA